MEKHPGTSNNCDKWESDVPPPHQPPPPQKTKQNIAQHNKNADLKIPATASNNLFLIFPHSTVHIIVCPNSLDLH